jgi:hypothetical protein
MPATLTTVNTITKEIYQGKIRNQLNEEAIGWKRIERTSEGTTSEVGGKYVTFPIRVRRNQGIGARNELELLPNAGQQGWASVRVGLKYEYGRVRLSGQVMELANENYQAFASAMDLEMTGLKNDLAKDTNRQFYGTNLGTMATAAGAQAANVVTVSSVKSLEIGMQVDVKVGQTSADRAADRQITAINETTKAVTLNGGAFTATAGDIIVRQGNYNREITGLAAQVTATGALFNLDPAVEPSWAATVDSNGGVLRPLSEGLMITMTDKVRVKGGRTSLILGGLGVRRAYFNLLSQQRRYPSTTNFEGGFTGLAFNNGREIPMVDDPDAPDNTMYFLDEDKFKIYQAGDWSWMNRDGSIWKVVDGYDAYEAILFKYFELGNMQRNAHAVLTDLTEG